MSASPIDENVPPPQPVELSHEQRLALVEAELTAARQAHAYLFRLVGELGRLLGVNLRHRQVPGGTQFYWEKQGRIVVP